MSARLRDHSFLRVQHGAVTAPECFEYDGPGVPAVFSFLFKKYWLVFRRATATTRGASGIRLECQTPSFSSRRTSLHLHDCFCTAASP